MEFEDHISVLKALAPAGLLVVLRMGFLRAEREVNTLPRDWVETYVRCGFAASDPVMQWIFANSDGAVRLAGLTQDPMGVIEAACDEGLCHGAAAVACRPSDEGRRSYVIAYRTERALDDIELAQLARTLRALHEAFDPVDLTDAEIEAIRMQGRGLRLKQVAAELGISESAVKARLRGARRKTGARNASHLFAMARERGLV